MKKTVRIKLFKDNGRYNAPVFVGLNEYTALIPRGVEVSVPYAVARMLEESQAQDAAKNGNGRLARNKLEEAILNQSRRVVAQPDAALDELLPGDFELDEKE